MKVEASKSVLLGWVWIGSKPFSEIIFRKTRVFGNYEK